jgi:hypothetical protein
MATSVDPRLGALKANPLRIKGLRGERVRKNLAEVEANRLLGAVIDSAIKDAGLTRDEVVFRLKYSDGSALSRWIGGTERAPVALLLTLGQKFQQCFVLALAKQTSGINIQTVVTIGQEVRSA